MAKRLIDAVCAIIALAILWPLLLVAAIGIRMQSPGPVLYRARRAGRFGLPFEMLKLRTMHVAVGEIGSRITAEHDSRVFAFGSWLRRTKVDELPQLWNILRGDMAVIGPRPEDPFFVAEYRGAAAFETLMVRPGLASPGSLYHDSHGARILGAGDPEEGYRQRLLPVKLALDVAYVRHATLLYDVRIIGRTIWHVLGRLVGRRDFPEPPEFRFLRAEPIARRDWRHALASTATRRLHRTVGLLIALSGLTLACEHQTPDPPVIVARPAWMSSPTESILVGAGDIGFCEDESDARTGELLDRIPGTVFTTGDHAYPQATAERIAACYVPSWGRHHDRTRPTPGNHDYHTADTRAAYHDYFGPSAGAPGRGWYSYNVGTWHVIVLNSEIAMDAASEQVRWLRAHLRTAATPCLLAYWHRPLFSSARRKDKRRPDARALWDALYAAGAEVILNGHDHRYERFAPQTPSGGADPRWGIRQFVVGTGGSSLHRFGASSRNSEVRRMGQPGVLALRLLASGYEWHFESIAPGRFSDSGSGQCHGAPPDSIVARHVR